MTRLVLIASFSLFLASSLAAGQLPAPEQERYSETLLKENAEMLRTYADDWKVELEPLRPHAVIGEPVWFRWTVTNRGRLVLPNDQNAAGQGWGFGPLRLLMGWGELTEKPLMVLDERTRSATATPFRPGETRTGTGYLLAPAKHRRTSSSSTDEFFVQVCQRGEPACRLDLGIESNVMRITINAPAGDDAAAIAGAGRLDIVLGLMGLGQLAQTNISELEGPIERGGALFGKKIALQRGFIEKYPNSTYTPYVLFHLLQLCRQGADNPPGDRPTPPNYAECRKLSERFLNAYASHPLADEVAFLHAWALSHGGNNDIAIDELQRLARQFPESHLIAPAQNAAKNLREGIPAARVDWKYTTRWFDRP